MAPQEGEPRNISGAIGAMLIVAILLALFVFTRGDRLDALLEAEHPSTTAAADPGAG